MAHRSRVYRASRGSLARGMFSRRVWQPAVARSGLQGVTLCTETKYRPNFDLWCQRHPPVRLESSTSTEESLEGRRTADAENFHVNIPLHCRAASRRGTGETATDYKRRRSVR